MGVHYPLMTRPLPVPGITEGLPRPRTTARRRLRPTMRRRQLLRITPRRPRRITLHPRIRRITPPGSPRRLMLRRRERDTTRRPRFSTHHLRTTVRATPITRRRVPTTTHVRYCGTAHSALAGSAVGNYKAAAGTADVVSRRGGRPSRIRSQTKRGTCAPAIAAGSKQPRRLACLPAHRCEARVSQEPSEHHHRPLAELHFR
jgi:hypothetical protein